MPDKDVYRNNVIPLFDRANARPSQEIRVAYPHDLAPGTAVRTADTCPATKIVTSVTRVVETSTQVDAYFHEVRFTDGTTLRALSRFTFDLADEPAHNALAG